ncbi:MAG TPA: hypothetical protein VFY32_15235, partial [Solirubrobacteraceae bacterium]|nr:hypothetical protein [Solirubrobacteraceae bacterium]
ATVLAIVALALAASGGALAASRSSDSITACVHKTGGGLYRAKHCAKHDSKLTWSTAGPRGVTGPQGPDGTKGDTGAQGPQGAPGSAGGFAYVTSDGTVARKGGSVDIAIHKVHTGEYCLKTHPSLGTFVPIVATIQGPDLTPGLISVNTSTGSDCNNDGGVGVFTMNPAGAAADHDFVVAVMGDASPGGEGGAAS